jgi:hypothetical protein
MVKFYLEPKMYKVEIAFETKGPAKNPKAQAIIHRISLQGTSMGGAVDCKTCDPGSIANSR